MEFRITFGPPDARQTEHPVNIKAAADRYRELEAAKVMDIAIDKDGEALDPRLLLGVSPAKGRLVRGA
jgi:hypothetical protein